MEVLVSLMIATVDILEVPLPVFHLRQAAAEGHAACETSGYQGDLNTTQKGAHLVSPTQIISQNLPKFVILLRMALVLLDL
jgi:putative intracellular protease/amidase